MPKPLGKKGFYVSAPLIGATLFLVAAVLAATVAIENEARIQVARSADVLGKLQFMSQAILADSYDVLLQTKLETMTRDFLEKEHFDMDTQEDNWKHAIKSNLQDYYISDLGETLGLNLEAYAEAYSNVPGIDKCKPDRVGGYQSTPSAYDSDTNDGTIMVVASSYGERVQCDVDEPEGNLSVDILGRAYRVNIRVARLYDVVRWVIITAKGALNSGMGGVPEPIASWSSPRWVRIKKADNTLVDPQKAQLQGIMEDWDRIMKWLSDRIVSVSNNYIRSTSQVGICLKELSIEKEENERERELTDFDISCVKEAQNRNCMPFRLKITLGDTDCSKGGEPPENAPNPFYHLRDEGRWTTSCGVSNNCPPRFEEVMYQIMSPVESVCVDYFAYTDSVYPVCKKWEAKEKSVTIKGVAKDDHENYVVTGSDQTNFRFKDQHPTVEVDNVKKNRLRCDNEGEGELKANDIDIYKDNVRFLLENLVMNYGVAQTPGSSIKRWVDKGSAIRDLNEPALKEVYKNIYGQGFLPTPCFMRGIRPSERCKNPETQEKPRVEIWMDWDEIRANCINKVDELCQALYSEPSLTAVPDYTETFCKNLFPEKEDVAGGYGRLRCTGKGAGTYIEIGTGDSLF